MEFTHLSKSVIQILWCGHRKETYWSSVFTCYQQVILLLVYKVKFETFSFLIMSIESVLDRSC